MFNKQNLFSPSLSAFLIGLILVLGLFALSAKPILANEIITENRTLTEDINGPVIINANNITLDCQGHKIIGSDEYYSNSGIYLGNRTGVVIKNCHIVHSHIGISLSYSSNNQLVGNEIIDSETGILFWRSSDNQIVGNKVAENGAGVSFLCSSDNLVIENNISNNGEGVYLNCAVPCSNNLIYHNNFIGNGKQVADYEGDNFYDNGYSSGGNYWSDYEGNDTDENGIGDASYIFDIGEDHYPFIEKNGWKEGKASEWRKSILAGDILYDPFTSGAGHVGLYVGNDEIIEAVGVSIGKSDYPGEVEKNPITDWDYPQRDTVYLLRAKKLNNLSDAEWNEKIANAIDFAKKQQSPTAKPYDWHWNKKQYDIDSPSWYCSELVWAAYFNQGVDLEFNSLNIPILFPAGLPIITNFSPVSPAEIFHDEDTETISSHLEGSDEIPWYKEFAPLFVLSPVNVIITDKDGNTLSQSENNIPGATFVEDQTDADGHKYSIIYLPVEYGPYKIQVVRKPEPDAQDGDKYSLKTQTEDGDKWLAKNQPAPEGDEEHKYDFNPAALNDDDDDNNNDSATGGFNDTEESSGNTCQAGTLDFSLSPPEIIEASIDASIDASIIQKGTLGFKYKIRTEISEGDDNFCSDLEISATIGENTYSGKLGNFSTPAVVFDSPDNWEFKITDPENNPIGETCDFNIIFEGWQENMNYGKGGFTDEEIISGTVESEGEILPPSPEPGDVIINEVMWMGSEKDDGSNKTSDEWIELYNTTDHDIDIGQWEIENARSSGNSLMIPANKIISPNDYFLIANYPETSENSALNVEVDEVNASISLQNDYDTNGALVLKDNDGNIIDSTPIPVNDDWPAGESNSDEKQSMERNDDPDSGWHTCDPLTMSATELSLMKSYWDGDPNIIPDEEWKNYGTPGAANLSENDPSDSSNSKNIQELKIIEPPVQELLPPEPPVVKPKEEDIGDEEIEIKIEGKLDLADGLKIKKDSFEQKIKEIELRGAVGELEEIGDEIIINLNELDKVKEAGEFKFKIENLDLPENLEVTDYTARESIFKVEIEKEDEGKKPEPPKAVESEKSSDDLPVDLDEDNKAQKKYDELISEADKYFKDEDYEKAKSSYEKAMEIKPDEEYPKNQLNKIKEILEELAKEKAVLVGEEETGGES